MTPDNKTLAKLGKIFSAQAHHRKVILGHLSHPADIVLIFDVTKQANVTFRDFLPSTVNTLHSIPSTTNYKKNFSDTAALGLITLTSA